MWYTKTNMFSLSRVPRLADTKGILRSICFLSVGFQDLQILSELATEEAPPDFEGRQQNKPAISLESVW